MTITELLRPTFLEVINKINEIIQGKLDKSAIVTSISDQSTDDDCPSAKCVYDAIDAAGGVVDGELSITSVNAVMNKTITSAIADLSSNLNMESYLDMIISGDYSDLPIVLQSSYNGDLDDIIEGVYQ